MEIKRCFVPMCNNNSHITPIKIFVVVPFNKSLRESWFAAVSKPLSNGQRKLYCCEDHFNLSEAVENWNYYKTFGSRLTLKKGVLPSPDLKPAAYANVSQFSPSSRKRKLEINEKSTSLDSSVEPSMETIPLEESPLIGRENVRRKGYCSRTTQTNKKPDPKDAAVNTKRVKSTLCGTTL